MSLNKTLSPEEGLEAGKQGGRDEWREGGRGLERFDYDFINYEGKI